MSAKLCKYNCSAMLTWDTSKNKFVEADGTLHTPDRCKSLREKPVVNSTSNTSSLTPEAELEVAIKAMVAAIKRMRA